MIDLKFEIKHFVFFTISFLFFTIIGILSHEYGHILVAKSYGYKTYLHYGSMHFDYERTEEYVELETFYNSNKEGILDGSIIYPPNNLKNYNDKLKSNGFWITVGGPTQTMLTGILGLVILYFRKDKKTFQFVDWLAVFLSLFWLREVFNLLTGLIQGFFFNKKYFGGDEFGISQYLELPTGTVSIILGFLGLLISLTVIFKIVPKINRFTFILSGLVGGLSGFYLWGFILGPILLP